MINKFKIFVFIPLILSILVLMLMRFSSSSGVIDKKINFIKSSNGLSGDIVVHDPVMIKENDIYYIFHTGMGVSIKNSLDRHHWKNAGSVFSKDALPAWHK